jgi:hypothetical protein
VPSPDEIMTELDTTKEEEKKEKRKEEERGVFGRR